MKKTKRTPAKKSSTRKAASAKQATIKARGTTKKKIARGHATGPRTGIKKQYLNSRNVCKVTFRLPRVAAAEAEQNQPRRLADILLATLEV